MFKEFVRRLILPFVPEELKVEDDTWKSAFFHWLYEDPVSISDEFGRQYPPDYDFLEDPWHREQQKK